MATIAPSPPLKTSPPSKTSPPLTPSPTLKTAPYGTWDSPITADAITGSSTKVLELLVDPTDSTLYHLETRPAEGGRCVLVETIAGRDVVGKDVSIRNSVHEYGGASAVVHGGIAYYSSGADGRVYRVKAGGEPEAVTPESDVYRFADFHVHPTHPQFLVSVLEDHTSNTPEDVLNTLCIIDTHTRTLTPLVSGADFYAAPSFSPDGTHIAWQQWYHPDLPWGSAEIHVADVVIENDVVAVKDQVHVAGERLKVSVAYPSWASNDTLLFTSDVSGYQNPWKYTIGSKDASPVYPAPLQEDCGIPAWLLGWSPYAVVDAEGKWGVFSHIRDGRTYLYLVDIETGSRREIESPYVDVSEHIRSVPGAENKIVFLGGTVDAKSAIVECAISGLRTGVPEFKFCPVISRVAEEEEESSATRFSVDLVSIPRPFTLETPQGEPVYIVYYPPHNPEYFGSSIDGERPPCVVSSHGGPTMLIGPGLNWTKQYFTSRGWGWLDVNYGGSSGYGRAYRNRLAGQWGIVDVEDIIFAARTISLPPYNLVDPARLVIRGSSSGGLTTLAALSNSSDLKLFAAGTSLYGISDLVALSQHMHKFEMKYGQDLLGGLVDEVTEVYRHRSPITHADKIVSPLLILQGDADKVVPKAQAELIHESIKRRGGVVEFKLYEGEGHGWRQQKNMKDALERELAWYERVLKLN